jgi:DNA (cytosine-5)-methyltransferase 1
MLKVLDLFSGIGGFSLGLERTEGFETVAFCEIEPFPRSVLKTHWPDIPIYEDVTKLDAKQLKDSGIEVDVICGGFPCQDISAAGKGAGLNGKRSGLWYEFHRLIKEIKPQYAIIENVSVLRSRGLDDVLGSLAEIGYDAEWHCIPASAVGAPHQRDRIWIIAYPSNGNRRVVGHTNSQSEYSLFDGSSFERSRSASPARPVHISDTGSGNHVADSGREHGNPGRIIKTADRQTGERNQGADYTKRRGNVVADTSGERVQGLRAGGQQEPYSYVQQAISMCLREGFSQAYWEIEPDVDRVVDGFPKRVDRLKALGNAVVPQIPEIIGHAILDFRL